ncbi:GGDEF domain-containing protein [Shewanella sp. Isolate13]|uniref:GGDEF domain-containing protein n=1 Tax=Shewanella sp. Isolate13 TaxID=2908531 RepID=UPI001EFE8285|nr:GGDEF domain-containing protein [Shewanella sp. Isolate13]MCG9732069.1 GGDEF domain-containing protein [Shewanella sp. Isolate13]
MRETIQTLGRLNTVILITAISVFASVFITFMAFYLRQNGGITHIAIFLASFIPLTVSPLVSWHLMGLLMKIDKLEKEMRKLASLDPLTELFNRRAFFNDANLSIRRAEQERRVVSVIALDLDRFKVINDRYGHSAGDLVLRHFAASIKANCRATDLIGRLGGEEFALLLPNTSAAAAYALAQRLHLTLRQSVIAHEHSKIGYTVSVGVVSLVPRETDTIETLLNKADRSLYLAKETGRNCTVVFDG